MPACGGMRRSRAGSSQGPRGCGVQHTDTGMTPQYPEHSGGGAPSHSQYMAVTVTRPPIRRTQVGKAGGPTLPLRVAPRPTLGSRPPSRKRLADHSRGLQRASAGTPCCQVGSKCPGASQAHCGQPRAHNGLDVAGWASWGSACCRYPPRVTSEPQGPSAVQERWGSPSPVPLRETPGASV